VIGFENASLYIGTKHAVIGITKTASIKWFRRGVRVNALCPGLIETPFHHRGIWPSVEAQHAFAASTPAGRFGSAEEMATVVAFLASDDSSYVSGHALIRAGRRRAQFGQEASFAFPDAWTFRRRLCPSHRPFDCRRRRSTNNRAVTHAGSRSQTGHVRSRYRPSRQVAMFVAPT
jgi:hypothetical protein